MLISDIRIEGGTVSWQHANSLLRYLSPPFFKSLKMEDIEANEMTTGQHIQIFPLCSTQQRQESSTRVG